MTSARLGRLSRAATARFFLRHRLADYGDARGFATLSPCISFDGHFAVAVGDILGRDAYRRCFLFGDILASYFSMM